MSISIPFLLFPITLLIGGESTLINGGIFVDDYEQDDAAINGWYIYDDHTGSKGNPLVISPNTGITYHGPTKRDINQGYYQRKFKCPTYSKVGWEADIAYCSPSTSTSNTIHTYFNGQDFGNVFGWVSTGTGTAYNDSALITASGCNNWETKKIIEPNCDVDSGISPKVNAMEEFDFKFKFRLIGGGDYAVVWNFKIWCDETITPAPTLIGQSTIISNGVFNDDYLQNDQALNGWYIYDDHTGSKGNPLVISCDTGLTYHGVTKRDTNQGYYQRKFKCPYNSRLSWRADVVYCSPSTSTSNTVHTFFNDQDFGNAFGWVLKGTGTAYTDAALVTASGCNNWEKKVICEPNGDVDNGIPPEVNSMQEFDFKFKFRLIGGGDYAAVTGFKLVCNPANSYSTTDGVATIVNNGVFYDDYLQNDQGLGGWYIYDDHTGSKGNPLIKSCDSGITYHGPTKRDINQGFYQRKFKCPYYSNVRWTADIAYCSPSSSTSNSIQTYFNGEDYGNMFGWVLMGTGTIYNDDALIQATNCNNWETKEIIEPNGDVDNGISPKVNAMEEFDFKFKFRLIGGGDYAVIWNFKLFCDQIPTSAPTTAPTTTAPTNSPTTNSPTTNSPTTNSPTVAAPIDCLVSRWGDWTDCTAECGGGTQRKYRTVIREAANGGNGCPATTKTRRCNTDSCTSARIEQVQQFDTNNDVGIYIPDDDVNVFEPQEIFKYYINYILFGIILLLIINLSICCYTRCHKRKTRIKYVAVRQIASSDDDQQHLNQIDEI